MLSATLAAKLQLESQKPSWRREAKSRDRFGLLSFW
jgi:hypothetical protein